MTGAQTTSQSGARAAVVAAKARIDALEPSLHALISDLSETALQDAEALDARGDRRALSGVLVTLKDVIDLQGVETTNGAAFPAKIASEDAEITRRLRAAGAIFMGKTNLHEFAYGGTTQNPHFGSCRNPWDVSRIAGGSSGGSAAAVAAGYCELSMGSDTAGSGRMPAALTGICALRPTLGRISCRGVTPCSPFFDTVSPMAKTVEMLARGYFVIAGYDPLDPLSVDRPVETDDVAGAPDLRGCRIGIARGAYFDGESDPAVAACMADAVTVLTALGAECVPVEIPDIAAAPGQFEKLFHTDARAVHAERLATAPELFGVDIRERLETLGGRVTGAEYAAALYWAAGWRRRLEPVLGAVDVILHPAVPTVAPRVEDCRGTTSATRRLAQFCYPWSLAGVPSMTVPCGFGGEGLACGMMLVADWWRETDLLRAGAAYQAATDWHEAGPDINPIADGAND
jgi:aspartyl-tRNA(Asn)/glutamyl-tRNA(Gln) amidotransferase subunit A